MDQIVEQWRPVVGCEGRYEVSDQGRVRSLAMPVGRGSGGIWMKPGKVLKQGQMVSGPCRYWMVGGLRKRHSRELVHVLVLEAFVGPRPAGMIACHGPGGSLDNRPENLSWGTHGKNNGEDRVRDGTHIRGERNPGAKLTADQVVAIRGDERSALVVAKDYGISWQYVYQIRNRERWAWVD